MAASMVSDKPTYHNVTTAAYTLPNDAPEHVRLEVQAAHLSAIMNNKLVHAPLSSPTLMLDVGCGTGIVTRTLARTYPSATAYGIDLSPVPAHPDSPPNVRYIQGDILALPGADADGRKDTQTEAEKVCKAGTFDYIYSRLLLLGINDWPRYLREAHRMLKPGGWCEIHELDWIWYDGAGRVISDDWEWLTALREVSEARGLDFAGGGRVKERMEQAGYVDVKRIEYRWPFGGEWEETEEMRAFGEYVANVMPSMLHHIIRKMVEGKGYGEEQLEEWTRQMRRDFQREKGKHWNFYITVGKKAE